MAAPMFAATFIPNGLLEMHEPSIDLDLLKPDSVLSRESFGIEGTSSPDQARGLSSEKSIAPEESLVSAPPVLRAFISNGLLQSSPRREFIPNELLGSHGPLVSTGASTEDSFSQTSVEPGSASPIEETIPASDEPAPVKPTTFKRNGLLDREARPSQEDKYDLTMEDDSADLPSLSMLLGIPSRPPPVVGTTSTSRTVKFPRRTKKKARTALTRNERDSLQLLEKPIHRLLDDLALDAMKPAKAAYEHHDQGSDARMWVDRYRPKRFPDLLGDERIHRETMAWLKEWDTCVFGKKKNKKRPRETDPSQEGYIPEDQYGRPYEKILLLSGPPGLGKTTLAHVIASAAGYAVFELNASDERAARIIDDRIRPALEAGSMVGAKKPVCVVIDEIDGVGGAGGDSNAFIQKLIQLTLDKPKKKTRRDGAKEARPLLRPIICICNDLYAPSLKALRPHARLVRLKPPTPLLLINRLRDVCEQEGLQADARALGALVVVTKGDIRSCLNTLQFIQSRTDEVTEAIVRSATVGMKDSEVPVQAAWDDIFLPLSKKRVKQLGLSDDEESRYVTRLHWAVEATDEVERVMQGCFAHYPKARTRDTIWTKFEKAHSWLDAFDLFTGSFRGDDIIWAAREYRSYCVVAFAPLFSAMGNSKAEWPSADYDCFVTSRANEEMFSSFAKQLSAESTRSFTQDLYPTEFLPLLNRIISPPIRTVNNQIIKPDERVVLDNLVATMADLKLQFVQEKTEEGQLVYRLDPPIDVFVTYDGKRTEDVGASRYAVRHLVAQRVDLQLKKRSTEIVETGKGAKMASFFGSKATAPGPANGRGPYLSTKKTDADPKSDPADKPPTDFFGRPLVVKPKTGSDARPKGNDGPPAKKFRVAYKFHEGNSAAVRRPIKVSSLL